MLAEEGDALGARVRGEGPGDRARLGEQRAVGEGAALALERGGERSSQRDGGEAIGDRRGHEGAAAIHRQPSSRSRKARIDEASAAAWGGASIER